MSVMYPNGAGQTLGDIIAVGKNLATLSTARVLYVGLTNASDSDTGEDPLRPWATLGKANTDGTDDDIIVLMDGFLETRTAVLNITEKLIWSGGGSSAGQPTARIGMNAAATTMLNITGNDVEFRNIKFPSNTQTNSASRIVVAGTDILFQDCYFEGGATDTGAIVEMAAGANRITFNRCTFVSTAISSALRPAVSLLVTAAVTRLDIHNCIFDNGTVGWSAGVAASIGSLTRLRASGNTSLRGADIAFSSTTIGYVQAPTVTGGAFFRTL